MDSKVFRIATIFKKPHPDLLDFSEDRLYLISPFLNTHLSFPEDTALLKSYKLCLVILIADYNCFLGILEV